MDWSADRVLALAPDAGSASAGQGLAITRKWSSLGASDRAIWGLCQGSGKDPYQTRIDLGEPVFKCSCPSRKFPCKHGLGLLLLFAKEKKSFTRGAEPGWVSEWIDGRAEKAEKKAEKAKAAAEAPVDVAAQAKRAAVREDRVRQGVTECRTWLDDLLRRGLAAAQSNAVSECERAAARMVDAQAPGLAGMIRRIPPLMSSGAGWEVRTLEHLGRLHLLLSAADRVGELPGELAGDVRVAIGYNQPKEEVLAGQGVSDLWTVVGQAFEEDHHLTMRRTWLWSKRTARAALVLDFAAGHQPLDTSLVAGMAFEGEVVFYPSGAPLRALVKSRGEASRTAEPPEDGGANAIGANLERFARALSANPWLTRWPMVLHRTKVFRAGDRWMLGQGEELLPLSPAFERGIHLWRLLSATGGREATIVAEWDGEAAEPVGLFVDAGGTRYVGLVTRWAA
ncbi:MAG: SWIM zinc finger family protein [Planctomycetes bacterium]|nr:SWIM zinc finger family protein [Planctomycetota bacterium]